MDCRASHKVQYGGVYSSGTEYRMLKFSMQTRLISANALMNLDNVNVLYLDKGMY